MPDKISLEELERRVRSGEIGEREIRRYFRTNENIAPKPFFPGIEPDPNTVNIPPLSITTTWRASFGVGDILIEEQRSARNLEFAQHVRTGYKPIVVSRGDSWFLHPLLWETIDWLRGGYAIHSFDWPGDTLDDILNDKADWQAAIQSDAADIFMLSGGGNDVIGGGAITSHLNSFDPNISDPAGYLKPSYYELVESCLLKIQNVFESVLGLSRKISIVCHGYDRVIPNGGKWLGNPMNSIGILDPILQKKITDLMIDNLNQRLSGLAKAYAPRVYHIDLRGVVTAGWDDELHPSEAGFRQIASHFRGVIDLLSPPQTG